MNKMRSIKQVRDILRNNEYTTKIQVYFATKEAQEGYDKYEKNYTYTNLNPLTIKAYVREINPEALVWKQYGLSEIGAKEILCEERYKNWFTQANKIVIDGDEYEVYREGTGNNAIISKRPYNLIRVVVSKKA
jgi:hypothetical protein